ncbi:hypothetical protein D029_3975, partial [Vibrio parahaemolyticus 970107]|jgi:hypothetical protein
MPPFP